jgi:hypothetical protein
MGGAIGAICRRTDDRWDAWLDLSIVLDVFQQTHYKIGDLNKDRFPFYLRLPEWGSYSPNE